MKNTEFIFLLHTEKVVEVFPEYETEPYAIPFDNFDSLDDYQSRIDFGNPETDIVEIWKMNVHGGYELWKQMSYATLKEKPKYHFNRPIIKGISKPYDIYTRYIGFNQEELKYYKAVKIRDMEDEYTDSYLINEVRKDSIKLMNSKGEIVSFNVELFTNNFGEYSPRARLNMTLLK